MSSRLHALYFAALGSAVLLLAGCFPAAHDPGPRLRHFPASSPAPGEPMPDVRLVTLDGEEVELVDVLGNRPAVIRLGSHTCPVYRYRSDGMERVRRRFGDRVDFLVVYTREAHPVGSPSPYTGEEWDTWFNRIAGVRLGEPPDLEARRERAAMSRRELGLQSTVLVDLLDDEAWRRFGAAPSPLFVVDGEGGIVARQVWTDPEELAEVLAELVDEPGDTD